MHKVEDSSDVYIKSNVFSYFLPHPVIKKSWTAGDIEALHYIAHPRLDRCKKCLKLGLQMQIHEKQNKKRLTG